VHQLIYVSSAKETTLMNYNTNYLLTVAW